MEVSKNTKCPIRADCPFAEAGKCSVYGYILSTEVIGWLKFCPQYDWRFKGRRDEYHRPFYRKLEEPEAVTEALTI